MSDMLKKNNIAERRILIIDDDADFTDSLADILRPRGYDFYIAKNEAEATEIINNNNIHLVLIDIRIGKSNGLELLAKLKDIRPGLVFVMMTAYASTETAIEAMQTGAYDYIRKPLDIPYFLSALNRYFEKIDLELEKAGALRVLRENEEKYRTLVENINIGVYRSTAVSRGEFIQTNTAFIKMFGYDSMEELNDIPISNLYQNPEDRKLFLKELRKDGLLKNRELFLKKKDGTPIITSCTAKIQYDEDGMIKWIDGVIEDITERKRAEESLQKSEKNLKEAQKIAHVGSFDWDVRKNFVEHSDEMARIHGLNSGQLPIDSIITYIEKYVHPDDRDYLKEQISKILKKRENVSIDYRIIRPDGTIRTLHGVSNLTVNKEGKPVRIIGTILDITERKEAEEKLKEISIKDDLTGLYNRRGFFTLAEQQLKLAARNKKKLFLFFLDLDNMKNINDLYGHTTGDQALIDTADLLIKIFRESDIIARIGGDEFVVLAFEGPSCNPELFTDRLQKNLLELNRVSKMPYKISISTGVAHYNPERPCSLDNLLSRADAEMYEQKRKKTTKE